MSLITHYHILVYGSQTGYKDLRAQIVLVGDDGKQIGEVHFKEPGMAFPADSERNGRIRMNLPIDMYPHVLDILRNEEPVRIYFAQGRAFFGTASIEAVGEGE